MRKLIRILQKPEVVGEKVETLAQYPSQAHTVNLLSSLKESRTRGCSWSSFSRSQKYRIPQESHGGDGFLSERSMGLPPSKGQPEIKKREQTHLTEWPEAKGL